MLSFKVAKNKPSGAESFEYERSCAKRAKNPQDQTDITNFPAKFSTTVLLGGSFQGLDMWLGSPPCISHLNGRLGREQPYLRDLLNLINHGPWLLTTY